MRVSLFVFSLLLTACHPSFDVPIKGSSVIPAGSVLSSLLPPSFSAFTALDFSATQEFKNQGVPKENIQSVKLKSFTLTATAPTGAKLDFLKSIDFSVEAAAASKARIASKASVPSGSSGVTLDLDDVELRPYVVAPSMRITTTATGQQPAQETTVEAALVFEVVPKVF